MEENNKYNPLSPDHNKYRLEKLKELMPDLFTDEGRLNPEELKKAVDGEASSETERYEFKWYGKTEAKRNAFTPSGSRLQYDSGRSVNPEKGNHIIIEGENREVLKLLSSAYINKIKCIYIDPPYNTGNDFVYNDSFTESGKEYGERSGSTEKGIKVDTNPETSGRYHSVWLSMMYSRLLLARKLLKPDGAIFVSIDDHEIHNLRRLMDEVFGAENFRNTFIVRRYDKNVNRQFIHKGLTSYNTGFEYVVCYSKTQEFKFNPVFKESSEDRRNYGYWKGFWNNADRPTMRYDILGMKPETGQWKWEATRARKAVENYREYLDKHSKHKTLEKYWRETGEKLEFIRRNPQGKGKNKGVEHWIPPAEGILRNTAWTDMFASKSCEEVKDLFDFPKNVDLIKTIIRTCESKADIILDFFAGSGATGQAVMELNAKEKKSHRFIMVQLPEQINEATEIGRSARKKGLQSISEIAIERCRRVVKGVAGKTKPLDSGFKVYRLRDTYFPRAEFVPDAEKSKEENLQRFRQYLNKKEKLLETSYPAGDIFTEVLLKKGFTLNYTLTKQEAFTSNEVFVAEDENRRTLICLDNQLEMPTVEVLSDYSTYGFICLEKALDTTKKWKLQHSLGTNLNTI
ncbi:MAG: site-specific DNA-methyltransferase [Bacteroidales bacterium]|nr:site-specific DNA-methyltransferase [Bacteroidales bacterium]MCF8334402.1 site-specific DNA-methyltransferase [Bacteroidales bacterium]